MRWLLVPLLCIAMGHAQAETIVVEEAEEPDPAQVMPELDAMLDRAIAAGLPDPAGCAFWKGDWIGGIGGECEYSGPGFPELHLRLADGRWLMRGYILRAAAAPQDVLADGFVRVSPDASDEFLFGMETPVRALAVYAARGGLASSRPMVETLASSMTGRKADGFEWTALPPPGFPGRDLSPAERQEAQNGGILAPAESLRRQLHMLLVMMAMHAQDPTDTARLVAAALSLLDEDERRVRGEAVARLVELEPPSLAGPSAFACVVAGWDVPVYREVRRGDHVGEPSDDPQHPPWRSTDVDGLLALADSDAPSRWIDSGFPRTLGDNALRALAWLWGVDPRVVAGRDPAAIWSADERHATAASLRERWRSGSSLSAMLLADPSCTPLLWTSRMVVAADVGDHPLLARAVATAWRDLSDSQRDALPPDGVERILGLLGDDPELDRLAMSWPLAGPLRRALALWHETHGEHAPLTELLRLRLEATGVEREGLDSTTAMAVLVLDPDQERLDMLASAYTGPMGRAGWRAAHVIAMEAHGGGFGYGYETPLIDYRFGGMYGQNQLILALAYQGLCDERPALTDDGFASWFGDGQAHGMRVCDEIAAARCRFEFQHDLADLYAASNAPAGITREADGEHRVAFDYSQDVAIRDHVLSGLRAALLPRVSCCLRALGLTSPAIAPVPFPAWWQTELDAARADGKAIALLITNTATCPPCVQLERDVLTRPEWKRWADQHLRMVIYDIAKPTDADTEAQWRTLFNWYDGGGTPSLFLIDANGRSLGPVMGFHSGGPTAYIAEFEDLLGITRGR